MISKGIHHISSIVGDAQKNLDFYTKVLGLRLVKKTLNYDDKTHYHLYYGNENGSNGIVTSFPMNKTVDGRLGDGQVASVSYEINPESFNFWIERLESYGIETFEYNRFNIRRLRFNDPDGLQVEFIETDSSDDNNWSTTGIDSKVSFKGIERASLYSKDPKSTLDLMVDILGYNLVDEEDEYYLLKVLSDRDNYIELSKSIHGQGQIAVGTVHHIAFGVENNVIEAWRALLVDKGYKPTEIKDRHYFKSLYFREKGGILIELATQGPGLLIDEPLETLGERFIIPKHFEHDREEIIDNLVKLK